MAKKRKIADLQASTNIRSKTKRKKARLNHGEVKEIRHPVLQLHYQNVTTLRQCILTRFSNSASRKQRLRAIPIWGDNRQDPMTAADQSPSTLGTVPIKENLTIAGVSQFELSKLLDTTVIGFQENRPVQAGGYASSNLYRVQNIHQMSQKFRATLKSTSTQPAGSQNEIVDFAVGQLFNTIYRGTRFPANVLCNGFARSPTHPESSDLWSNGLYCTFPTCNAVTLQSGAWPALLKILGKGGDEVMLDLMFNCAIFVPLKTGRNNLCQISGVQLSELPLLKSLGQTVNEPANQAPRRLTGNSSVPINKRSDIKIIRNRMFYARSGLNGKGSVRLGMPHIHVFNRYPDPNNPRHVTHILKYVFPRQFGLHNVFTCKPDRRETIQPQKDYTMRDQEIAVALRRRPERIDAHGNSKARVPKRLRGFQILISRILTRHSRCAYVELLRHHCSVEWFGYHGTISKPESLSDTASSSMSTSFPPHGTDIINLATAPANVFAFCRSVLLRLLPPEIFDVAGNGSANMNRLLRHVAEFIHYRKRETLDLHSIIQSLRISEIAWLAPPSVNQAAKLAKSDHLKRMELLEELLYYIFDSILIPLIRSNFHVTESNNHAHHLFYFRHDVWRRLTEPCLNNLRQSMFEVEHSNKKSRSSLQITPYGHMRLVPKGSTFRPIMNLKRKPVVYQYGKTILGPRSVNMMLKPVYSMLKHEKLRHPGLLGSSMFSVDEVYPRLKQFRNVLRANGWSSQRLYFSKVDVTNCFDTIPQEAVIELAEEICDQTGYCSFRHAEVSARYQQADKDVPITKRFRDREPARGVQDRRAFHDYASSQYGARRANTVFVEQAVPSPVERDKLMMLLKDHISGNKVKIGKKLWNQKRGIPQGSILSSILCNFFYGQFEGECLSFSDQGDSLLLRLLDDFLFITLDKEKASKFLQVMHRGSPKYGISIKAQKSMANFPYTIDGYNIAQCDGNTFPYCGKTINTTTLEIGRDRERQIASRVSESLTIERSKTPGEAFYRLTLDAMKRQLHAQYTDSTLNSAATILQTLYQDFSWSALRMQAYIRGLGPSLRPIASLVIRTISDLAKMTFSILTSPSKLKEEMKYECWVSSSEVQWLAAKAYKHVFQTKQNLYGPIAEWLDAQLANSQPKNTKALRRLQGAVSSAHSTVDW